MQADNGSREDGGAIARGLERWIFDRTQGRIHGVRIEVTTDRLIIHGWTATYHVKQLALEAIGELTSLPVELDIQVDAAKARAE